VVEMSYFNTHVTEYQKEIIFVSRYGLTYLAGPRLKNSNSAQKIA
jgi:hypothetical protein